MLKEQVTGKNKMQDKIFSEKDILLHHPVQMMLCGPTGSGKSETTFNLIRYRSQLFDSKEPLSVMYCLPVGHHISIPPDIRNDQNVIFHEGMIDPESVKRNTILVMDDMMNAVESTPKMTDLFTRFSHHRSISLGEDQFNKIEMKK